MDAETYRGLKRYARTRSFRSKQDEEDFISFASEKILSNGKRNNFRNLYIDYIRSLYSLPQTTEFEEYMKYDIENLDDLKLRDIEFMMFDLEPYKRMIYILRHYYSFRIEEIAFLTGKTYSRISQEIKEVQLNLNKKIKKITT